MRHRARVFCHNDRKPVLVEEAVTFYILFFFHFSYNLGSGVASIVVNGSFGDGRWHRVKAVR